MIIYYKKQTHLTKYLESNVEDIIKFKEPGWLESIGFKSTKFPDIYFHTGSLNSLSKTLIENSKIVIVNSSILKDDIVKKLNINNDNIKVIYPSVDIEKFKKKDIKVPFYKEHNIELEKKIIYFTAKNFKKSGFDDFCDILTKIEQTNFKAVITCSDEKELIYVKDVLKNYSLDNDVLIIEKEIFNISDIFVLPTTFVNFSINVVKAMASKCVAFVPETNYAVELVDVFSIMNSQNDSNTAYKIDMLLRINDELKKLQKENYNIGKKLTLSYQEKKLDNILENMK